MKESKEQQTRRWQRPREKAAAVRAREERARIQEGAVLSSFATNEQKKVRIVVPLEIPHDTGICVEDLVDMEIDQLKENERKTAREWDPRTQEENTCESDARLDKNHEHSSGMQESIEAEALLSPIFLLPHSFLFSILFFLLFFFLPNFFSFSFFSFFFSFSLCFLLFSFFDILPFPTFFCFFCFSSFPSFLLFFLLFLCFPCFPRFSCFFLFVPYFLFSFFYFVFLFVFSSLLF